MEKAAKAGRTPKCGNSRRRIDRRKALIMVEGKYINVPTKVRADLSNDIKGSINFFQSIFFPV